MGILEFAKSTSGHFFRKGTILRNQGKSSSEVHDYTSCDSLIIHHPDTIKDLRKGIPCHYQYRIIDRTGKVKWVEDHTFPVLDSNGLLVRLDGLITDISIKKLEEEKINYYAYHDYLTGLPNRRMFEGKMDQFITDKQGKSERFALLYLDLDRFKFVNDTLGHMIGDELLKQVSSRLANHLKDHDHLARLGGDEFAIIVNNLKDTNEAIKIASNIIKDIENPFTVGDYNLNITTSIGIGVYPEDGLTLKELFANTDVALYRAKGMGKNNLQLYSPSMNIESYKEFLLVNDLRDAIKDNQFVLHYQPKVNPKTREIVGAEALIRWNHPEWGTLSPNEFIPLAEETNLIIELGDWVITTVCKQIKKWKEDGKRVVPVSINLSAKRFLKDDLVSTLEKVLEETNIESKWLEFEITETSLIQNEERALSAIKLLKDIGITISLDDFGTGYSSISYLKKFKVDFLKIDRSFIKGIHSKTDDEAIIKSILFLAGELNIKVIAEGVETEEQLTFLLNHHCDLIQGFLFSKPLDVEVFTHLISKNRIPIQGQIEYKEVVPRREYFRIDLPTPFLSKMTIAEMKGKSVLLGDTQVVIENIGMGGLRFSTAFLLPVSKKLKLRIKTELFQQPFSVEGSILWREEVEDNHYQYGFEFELTEQKREWLSSELNQLTVRT